MIRTLRTPEIESEYGATLTTLDRARPWPREWAERQYVGRILTAMCNSVVGEKNEARRYAVLRVMETFMEHRHDLFPATAADFAAPRARVAKLAIPSHEEECEGWIDILEYVQLRNWDRKGIHSDPARVDILRENIENEFSRELREEIDEGTETWWAGDG